MILAIRAMCAPPSSGGAEILGTYYLAEYGGEEGARAAAEDAAERWQRVQGDGVVYFIEWTSEDAARLDAALTSSSAPSRPRRESPSRARRRAARAERFCGVCP